LHFISVVEVYNVHHFGVLASGQYPSKYSQKADPRMEQELPSPITQTDSLLCLEPLKSNIRRACCNHLLQRKRI
jgi:hypothetical protein